MSLRAFQSPADSIDYLKGNSADLVFLDVLMGEQDGWAVLRELRALANHRDTVVAIVTSKDYAQDRGLAKALNVREYLVKPLRSQEIRDIICRYTGTTPEADDDEV